MGFKDQLSNCAAQLKHMSRNSQPKQSALVSFFGLCLCECDKPVI